MLAVSQKQGSQIGALWKQCTNAGHSVTSQEQMTTATFILLITLNIAKKDEF